MELFPGETKIEGVKYLNPRESKDEIQKLMEKLYVQFPELRDIPNTPLTIDPVTLHSLPQSVASAFIPRLRDELKPLSEDISQAVELNDANHADFQKYFEVMLVKRMERCVLPGELVLDFVGLFKGIEKDLLHSTEFVGPHDYSSKTNFYKELFFTKSVRYGFETLAGMMINVIKNGEILAENSQLMVKVDIKTQLRNKIKFFGFSPEEQKLFNLLLLKNLPPVSVAENLVRTMNQLRADTNYLHSFLLSLMLEKETQQVAVDTNLDETVVTGLEQEQDIETHGELQMFSDTDSSELEQERIQLYEDTFEEFIPSTPTHSKPRVTLSAKAEQALFEIEEVNEIVPTSELKQEIQIDTSRFAYSPMTLKELLVAHDFAIRTKDKRRLENLTTPKDLSAETKQFITQFKLNPSESLQNVEYFVFRSPELSTNLNSFIIFLKQITIILETQKDFSMLVNGIKASEDYLLMAEETSNLFLSEYYVSRITSVQWIKNCGLKILKNIIKSFQANQ